MGETSTVSSGRMYSKAQIGVATFLGAPIAGAILMSRNAAIRPHGRKPASYLIIGAVATLLIVIISIYLPERFPAILIALPPLWATLHWYELSQRPEFNRHISEGGLKHSWWPVIGIGLLGTALVLVQGFVLAYILILTGALAV